MLSFLFFIAEWKNYQDRGMDELFEQAINTPVFAIVVTKNNRCRKFNQTFYDYAQKMKDSLDIKFTNIDCSKLDFCTKYGVRHLPKFVLIRNGVAKYWKYTSETEPIGWNNFLRYELSSPAYNTPQWSFEDIREQLYSGAAYYHLDVGNKSKALQNKYLELSMKIRMYGTVFTYSNVNSEDSILHYYNSNNCNGTLNNPSEKDMEDFIMHRYLSAYHRFDRKEIRETSRSKFIIFMANGRQEEKIRIMDQILEYNKCNSNFRYGISSMKSDRWLLMMSGKINLMENVIVGINIDNECTAHSSIWENGTILNKQFFDQLDDKKECQKIKQLRNDWHTLDLKMFIRLLFIFLGVSVVLFVLITHFNIGSIIFSDSL